jgi:hypothetical protein
MSAVCILAPVVIAAWPTFSAAVVAAASSLGYVVAEELVRETHETAGVHKGLRLEIAQSEIVTGQLGRNRQLVVRRDDVTVTFARDARGGAGLCVTGSGRTNEELRALGEQLSQRVVQQYVHQRLLDEARARGFIVVEDAVDENQSIRLKLRHWEN